MRITSLSLDRYQYILKLLIDLKQFNIFERFDTKDIFYINDSKHESIISVVKSYGEDTYGLSFFLDTDGLNTLHDMYTTTSDESLSPFNYSITNIMFIDKDSLTKDELDFFEKNNIEIKEKDNILIKTYKEGFCSYISSNKEADRVIELLLVLMLVLKNDGNDIVKGNSDNKIALIKIDYKNHNYSINMGEVPLLERALKFTNSTKEELEEFSGIDTIDREYKLLIKGLEAPVMIKDCNKPVLPLFILYTTNESVDVDNKQIIALPSDYRSYLIPILKEMFTKFGIPSRLIINNRKVYYELYKLLNDLGIDVVLRLENELDDEMLNFVNATVCNNFKTNINKGKADAIDPSEFKMFMKFISEKLNEVQLYDDNDQEEIKDEDSSNTIVS